MTFRKLLFWLHLIAGVVAGIVIAIMSFTGAALAFEKEIIAWAERDAHLITPPAGQQRLSLDELLAAAREQQPGRPSGITITTDTNAAVLVSFGRTNSFYVNPYTAEIREPSAKGVREFMRVMLSWHRFLGREENSRAVGKAITGACNAAFLVLSVTGLYLWWPRRWSKQVLRAVATMNFRLKGKARDWNWHNALGLWTAPILIVLTGTALPMSYRWAGDLIFRVTGTIPPQNAGPATAAPAVEVPTPPPDAKRLDFESLFAVAQKNVPNWKEISFRLAGPGGRGERRPQSQERSEPKSQKQGSARRVENENIDRSASETSPRRNGPQAVTIAVKTHDSWPLFATTTLSLDPFTGTVLKKETFADNNLGRQVRTWTRCLHTGEALGPIGQAIAGLASLGSLVLIWTGVALALRRFINWKSKHSQVA